MLKIVKASAGSGKTYTLVKEYLRLALRHPREHFKHILAITFTNKAANEMKERVLKQLNTLSTQPSKDAAMQEFLCASLGITPQELQERAQTMLQAMLHHYADIAICTIDSFTHQVIRGFAYELKLNMNVDIEMDTDALLTQVVELLLDEIEDETVTGENIERKNLSKALIEFATTKMDDEKSWRIEGELMTFSKNLLRDETFLHKETLEHTSIPALLELQKNIQAFIQKFRQEADAIATKAIHLIEQNGLTDDDFAGGRNGIYGYFRSALLKGGSYDNITGSKTHWKTIEEDKWHKAKGHSPALEQIKPQLKEWFLALTKMYGEEYSEVALARLINKNIFPFMLLQAVNRMLQSYKSENSLMLIGEFQHLVFSEVKEQPVPVIYERVGGRYDNIMIDEFQDTSVMQWHNLLPLIDNAVSNMNDCLIVGDAKQAIYRFRGGEVKQFSMLPAIYGSDDDWVLKEREININNHKPRVENLEFNYRSRAHIVEFNNKLYDYVLQLDELNDKDTYKGHEQKNGSDQAGGNVFVSFVPKLGKEDEINERFERLKEYVINAIQRGYAQRDIAVLVEKNKTGAAIASYLIEQGYSVVSPESLFIGEAPSVQLLECALRYLYRSDDLVVRAELLLLLRSRKEGSVNADNINVRGWEREFEERIAPYTDGAFNSSELNRLRLYDLLNKLCQLFSLDMGTDPFIQFFLDEVLLYSQKFTGNLQHFLEWWSKEKENKSIIYPETLDAIRIMTVHKSKGLEFPVVILPDADYSATVKGKQVWVEIDKPYAKGISKFLLPIEKSLLGTSLAQVYEKEQDDMFLERLNLLYVATTRPTDLLYVIAAEVKNDKGARINTLNVMLHRFVTQINAESVGDNMYQLFSDDTHKEQEHKKEQAELFEVSEAVSHSGTSVLTVRRNPRIFWKQSKLADIEYGNMLHELLSRIHYTDDALQTATQFCRTNFVSDGLSARLVADASAVINHPQLSQYYTPQFKIFNEQGIVINGQLKFPDRVVVDSTTNQLHIIEYKTGNPEADHKIQVKEYADCFSNLGFKIGAKLIVYTESGDIESI